VPLAECTHAPLLHVSVVQVFPSVHVLLLLARKTQAPFSGLHASSVHGLLSLQITGVVPTHDPLWHASTVVQALPSLQRVPLVATGFEQTPVCVSQVPAEWH
jgi:hypothetical protein